MLVPACGRLDQQPSKSTLVLNDPSFPRLAVAAANAVLPPEYAACAVWGGAAVLNDLNLG